MQNFRIRLLGGEFATEMTCAEAGCVAHRDGWFMPLNVEGDADDAAFATWIKAKSRRRFFEWRAPGALEEALRRQAAGDLTVMPALRTMLEGLAPGMLVFVFPPGQRCFRQHLDREVVFKHERGHMRDVPSSTRTARGVKTKLIRRFVAAGQSRIHANGRDFNEHQNEAAYRVGVLRQHD